MLEWVYMGNPSRSEMAGVGGKHNQRMKVGSRGNNGIFCANPRTEASGKADQSAGPQCDREVDRQDASAIIECDQINPGLQAGCLIASPPWLQPSQSVAELEQRDDAEKEVLRVASDPGL